MEFETLVSRLPQSGKKSSPSNDDDTAAAYDDLNADKFTKALQSAKRPRQQSKRKIKAVHAASGAKEGTASREKPHQMSAKKSKKSRKEMAGLIEDLLASANSIL